MSDKCPKCGSETASVQSSGGFNNAGKDRTFCCGSWMPNGASVEFLHESQACLRRQLAAKEADRDHHAACAESWKARATKAKHERDKAQAACGAWREAADIEGLGCQFEDDDNGPGVFRCAFCGKSVKASRSMQSHYQPRPSGEIHHTQDCPVVAENPGQPLLDRLEKAESRAIRVCKCGCLVSGQLNRPCDKCGSLEGELIEVAFSKLQADNARLREDVDNLRAMHVHCDNCGGSWLDDGINSGCHCMTIKLLREAIQSVWDDWSGSNNATDPDADGYDTLQKVKSALEAKP